MFLPDTVGFHATSSTDQQLKYTSGEQVLFQSAPINIGGGYNTSTSTFTCPAQGLYYVYINLNLMPDMANDEKCYIGLKLNDVKITQVYQEFTAVDTFLTDFSVPTAYKSLASLLFDLS